MLLADYDIVFQEVPGETTLALNISCCPFRCQGCHSTYLRQAVGEPLTEERLNLLIQRYPYLTCVSIQGGDADYHEVEQWAEWIHRQGLLSCWYSGRTEIPSDLQLPHFDYLKVGPYIEALGGLRSPKTNQRFYRIDHANGDALIDITESFHKRV